MNRYCIHIRIGAFLKVLGSSGYFDVKIDCAFAEYGLFKVWLVYQIS